MTVQSDAPTATSRRVLLVDDSIDILELYDLVLSARGYEVRTAASVTSAIDIIGDWRPHVVITDIVMPERTGLDLITWIRSNLAPPVPPIIALSGFPDVEREALRRGAATFKLKPVDAAALVRLIECGLEPRVIESDASASVEPNEHRRVISAIAEAAVEAALARSETLPDKLRAGTLFLSQYFGRGVVAVLLVRAGRLRVLCSSDPTRLPNGALADEILGRALDVIASGSSLVIPNAQMARALGMDGKLESRPVVSVPLVVDGVTLGNLSVFGDITEPFDSADLCILEYIARHAAILFTTPDETPLARSPYVLRDHVWKYFLQQELAHLPSRSITVAFIEVARELTDVMDIGETFAARTAMTRLDERRFGLFAVTPNGAESREDVTTTLAAIEATVGVREAAIVTFAGIESPNQAGTLLDIVEANLRTSNELRLRGGPPHDTQRGTLLWATMTQERTSADMLRAHREAAIDPTRGSTSSAARNPAGEAATNRGDTPAGDP